MTLETSAVERLDYIISATEKYEFDIPVNGDDLKKAFYLLSDRLNINLWDNVNQPSAIQADEEDWKVKQYRGLPPSSRNRSGIIKAGERVK